MRRDQHLGKADSQHKLANNDFSECKNKKKQDERRRTVLFFEPRTLAFTAAEDKARPPELSR